MNSHKIQNLFCVILFIVTDSVTSQGGGGMGGGGAGGGMGGGVGGSMGAGVGMGAQAGMGGGMNGGMSGSGQGQSPRGPPGRSFHGGHNKMFYNREEFDEEYPYAIRTKRSVIPQTNNIQPGQIHFAQQYRNADNNFNNEYFPQRNKRYAILIVPQEKSHQIQSVRIGQRKLMKDYNRFDEIFNEKIIFQMRSKRSPENTEEIEYDSSSSVSSSNSDSSMSAASESTEK